MWLVTLYLSDSSTSELGISTSKLLLMKCWSSFALSCTSPFSSRLPITISTISPSLTETVSVGIGVGVVVGTSVCGITNTSKFISLLIFFMAATETLPHPYFSAFALNIRNFCTIFSLLLSSNFSISNLWIDVVGVAISTIILFAVLPNISPVIRRNISILFCNILLFLIAGNNLSSSIVPVLRYAAEYFVGLLR